MRIFIAGGSGTIGLLLVRALVAAGHRGAVHGARDVGPPAALERESQGRARLAAEVRDSARGAGRDVSTRSVSHGPGRLQHRSAAVVLHRVPHARKRLGRGRRAPGRVAAHLESLFVLTIDGDAISAIRVVRNPDKLTRIDRQLKPLTRR